jgi:hypothetical protein
VADLGRFGANFQERTPQRSNSIDFFALINFARLWTGQGPKFRAEWFLAGGLGFRGNRGLAEFVDAAKRDRSFAGKFSQNSRKPQNMRCRSVFFCGPCVLPYVSTQKRTQCFPRADAGLNFSSLTQMSY